MITASDVARVASDTGFRADIVEKVLRLHGVLSRLDQHEITHGTWLLKGGTALNLVHLDVPRLSVDIDVNYVGAEEVEAMRLARPEFERALASCCAREGCDVRRAPSEHAGGKFRLRYPSVLGGSQNLEVDVSYVARVPVWGSVRSRILFPPDSDPQVPTLVSYSRAASYFTTHVVPVGAMAHHCWLPHPTRTTSVSLSVANKMPSVVSTASRATPPCPSSSVTKLPWRSRSS